VVNRAELLMAPAVASHSSTAAANETIKRINGAIALPPATLRPLPTGLRSTSANQCDFS